MIYQVAIASPLRRLFDYLPPGNEEVDLVPGMRVEVPFGRRKVVGIVVAQQSDSAFPVDKLKAIDRILDSEPVFSKNLLSLLLWAANYYHAPLGEALATALPTALRRGKPLPSEKWWRLSHHGKGLPEDALKRAPRQAQLLKLLQQGERSHRQVLDAGISTANLRVLSEKGLIESYQQTAKAVVIDTTNLLREEPLTLLPSQAKILDALDLNSYHAYLLEGETGSGKTEVYLQAIAHILNEGRQALVLIPEISLTPQTLQRFKSRFNCPIAVIHSGLSDGERLSAWSSAANGSAGIVIGTRSAVFTPLLKPGIIIIDEEHDGSFKQQDGFRYSARDVAVMRANREQIPIMLGTATPSLESLYNCQQGRYQHLHLTGRPGGASQPEWQLVDIRKLNLNTGFSQTTIVAMEQALARGHQVLVFLNRRGFAPTMMCHDCGWIANCKHCDARLTFHQSNPHLRCHHCDYRQAVPPTCSQCHSEQLQYLGQGTERGEATLEALFPDIPVLRVDRDTTRRKQAMSKVIAEINSGKPCVLVGTQILAKGHHFPNVTLVVVLDADSGLFSPDFRATERLGQLVTQVAGRAGRGETPGRVMIQSHHSEHPLLALLAEDQYPKFAEQLLAERRLSGMPPYTNVALVRAEATSGHEANALLEEARKYCQGIVASRPSLRYLGPYSAPLERRNKRFRYQLLIIAEERKLLHHVLGQLSLWLETNKTARKVRWSLDIDPQDMS
ncbi:MAG: primosomal protein N' [Porticoccaceae bacterium]|nr:primosomal protein N' [Porticoccaceae bacterium]